MPTFPRNDPESCPTITSYPAATWVFGACGLAASLVAFGVFAWVLFGARARVRPDQMLAMLTGSLLLLAMAAGVVAIGVAMILRPRITVAFDAGMRTATLSRRNLAGERFETVAFDEIAAIGQTQDLNEDGSAMHKFRAIMHLRDGRSIPLTATPGRYAEHEGTLARIRRVTGAEKRDTPVPADAKRVPAF